ncbi:Protein of unknown function [Gryllus bimaculatus]|nr:Protein of unknown function [Gryllus bimaculatus]
MRRANLEATTSYWYLGYSLDASKVRGQEASSVFMAVVANPDGLQAALDFFKNTDYDVLDKARVGGDAIWRGNGRMRGREAGKPDLSLLNPRGFADPSSGRQMHS